MAEETVEALRQLQAATAAWAATTNAPVEVAQALYTGRQALNKADLAAEPRDPSDPPLPGGTP